MLEKSSTVEVHLVKVPKPQPAAPPPKVRVLVNGQKLKVPYAATTGEVLKAAGFMNGPLSVLAAIVHHRCVDLDFPLMAETSIRPVTYAMREGVLVYRHTASLILLEAARQLWDDAHVSIGQSLSNGYFWEIRCNDGEVFTHEHKNRLEVKMRELAAQDIPLRTEVVILQEAKRIFAAVGKDDKLKLLKSWWEPHVTLVYCGETCDIHHYPVAPRTGLIQHFALDFEPGGVVLRFPQRSAPDVVPPYERSPQLRRVHTETREWLRLLGVQTVGELNELTLTGKAGDLIRIAEGLHEKKIAHIADQIAHREQPPRLVLIAGPSASGKTTFSKRLSLQLRVNGIRPVGLSTDNFYVNRTDTPLDEHGKYDFESIEAIDLPLFNEVLSKLLAGEEVSTPRFDFQSGERRPQEKWATMRLAPDQVLLVEGIHGLNPRLTSGVTEDEKFRVYVSALTQLSIDNHNRIFTSDTRLLRRIVRDRMFRGYTAKQTITTWPSVRRGEQRWIFPYQEGADVMFNSALVYEHAVLRLYAERFLLEVPDDDPTFVTAYRLLRFIEHFVPIFDETIPEISLLKEFIGKSYFDY
ncbi:MAG: nucleoside kinase [Deltaproteobacteria bacterium]|nr:nucleoside kinase [Deltaproteobacteria bacterium]